ncbi:MAG TPA: DALR domain-containing protein, partial [Polyangiaceae bacterium]
VLQGQAKTIDEAPIHVLAALDKDLSTPQALAAIVEMAKAANDVVIQIGNLKSKKAAQDSARRLAARAIQALDGACKPLGVMQANGPAFAARTRERRLLLRNLEAGAVEAKVQARALARTAHDFARADALRKELTDMGIEVLDSGTTSTWRVVL